MADRPFNVLFLCTGNSARSILAEAILSKIGAGKFQAFSAGSQPKGQVHPETLRLLQSLGFDVTRVRSKSWGEFARPGAPSLDFVFTVCDNAAGEACPFWPGQPMTAHWGIPDPAAAQGSDVEIALAFKDALRMLSQRIAIFTALPIRSLDKLSLQFALHETGQDADILEAYERLLHDVMLRERLLFTRSEQIERLWQVCAPVLDDRLALPKIFRAFVCADYRVEAAARRRLPEQRAHSPGRQLVELQRLVDRGPDQRPQIEQPRNGVGRKQEIPGQRSIIGRPVGRQHAGGEMSSGGMAADDERPPEPRQLARRHPHLPDNVIDGDIRAKVVAWNRDADTMGIQPTGEMAEK